MANYFESKTNQYLNRLRFLVLGFLISFTVNADIFISDETQWEEFLFWYNQLKQDCPPDTAPNNFGIFGTGNNILVTTGNLTCDTCAVQDCSYSGQAWQGAYNGGQGTGSTPTYDFSHSHPDWADTNLQQSSNPDEVPTLLSLEHSFDSIRDRQVRIDDNNARRFERLNNNLNYRLSLQEIGLQSLGETLLSNRANVNQKATEIRGDISEVLDELLDERAHAAGRASLRNQQLNTISGNVLQLMQDQHFFRNDTSSSLSFMQNFNTSTHNLLGSTVQEIRDNHSEIVNLLNSSGSGDCPLICVVQGRDDCEEYAPDPSCPIDDGGNGSGLPVTQNIQNLYCYDQFYNSVPCGSVAAEVCEYTDQFGSPQSMPCFMMDTQLLNETDIGRQAAAMALALKNSGLTSSGSGDGSSDVVGRLDSLINTPSELSGVLPDSDFQGIGLDQGSLESEVRSRLGVTGTESWEDLESTVTLSDFSNDYTYSLPDAVCPQPLNINVMGVSHSFVYDPICDIFSFAGNLVYLSAFFLTPWIIFGGRK